MEFIDAAGVPRIALTRASVEVLRDRIAGVEAARSVCPPAIAERSRAVWEALVEAAELSAHDVDDAPPGSFQGQDLYAGGLIFQADLYVSMAKATDAMARMSHPGADCAALAAIVEAEGEATADLLGVPEGGGMPLAVKVLLWGGAIGLAGYGLYRLLKR